MARKLAVALGLAALAIVWLGEFTDIDMLLAQAAYDPVLGGFPLRHAFLTEAVGHRWVRNAGVLAGASVLGIALYDLRFRVLSNWARVRMRVLALCAVLVPLAVSLLKRASAVSCPWDLQAFNGSQPYVRLFDAMPPGAAAGHCWPGGHASSALWLLGLVVFWLPHRPRRAALAACVLLGAGVGVGWIQQLRGAHFLSHTLWSAWIAAAITASLWYLMLHRPGQQFAARQRDDLCLPATWSFREQEINHGCADPRGTRGEIIQTARRGAGEAPCGNYTAGGNYGGSYGGGAEE